MVYTMIQESSSAFLPCIPISAKVAGPLLLDGFGSDDDDDGGPSAGGDCCRCGGSDGGCCVGGMRGASVRL